MMELDRVTSVLADFTEFLRQHHLAELAAESLRLNRVLGSPLLRLFEDMPEPELLQMSLVGLDTFLSDLGAGRALEAYEETLRLWEADRLPGIPRDAVQPADMVLVYAAQKQAILNLLPRFTSDLAKALTLVLALEDYYVRAQNAALHVFDRLRADAVQRAVQSDADRQAAQAVAEELQAANRAMSAANEELGAQAEELTSQAEELASQQEELNALYDELRRHTDHVEAQVLERTQELQAANEELAAQSEELMVQSDELMRANEEIERSRALLDGVLQNLPGAVGYCDKDMVIRLVNRAYAAQLGCAPEDLIDRPVSEVFRDHLDQLMPILNHVTETGEAFRAFGQPAGPDGDRFQDFVVVPVRDRMGALEGLMSLSFDATERVRLEKELAQQHDEVLAQKTMAESLAVHAPAGVAYLDADLMVRWVNPEFMRLTDRPADYYLGHSFLERASDETRPQLEAALRGVIETGQAFRADAYPYEMTIGGVPRLTHWDFNYVAVRGRDGKPEGILVFALDVSSRVDNERLQAEHIAELQQIDRYKDEFISVISHELRTPLNFIMGFASLLEDDVPGELNESQRMHVQKILHGADRMLALVDDLLDFARIQAGSFTLAPELAAFDMLVEDTVGTVRPLAEQKGLALVVEAEPGITATVDVQRVTQVLTNLLSNAIKFTERDGTITVRTVTEPGWVVAEVADTGVGIAEADLPKLFKRFQQLDMSATRKVGGTGLGLSIVKALVEAHQGTISVTSTPGAGSTFTVRLPA